MQPSVNVSYCYLYNTYYINDNTLILILIIILIIIVVLLSQYLKTRTNILFAFLTLTPMSVIAALSRIIIVKCVF